MRIQYYVVEQILAGTVMHMLCHRKQSTRLVHKITAFLRTKLLQHEIQVEQKDAPLSDYMMKMHVK